MSPKKESGPTSPDSKRNWTVDEALRWHLTSRRNGSGSPDSPDHLERKPRRRGEAKEGSTYKLASRTCFRLGGQRVYRLALEKTGATSSPDAQRELATTVRVERPVPGEQGPTVELLTNPGRPGALTTMRADGGMDP